MQPTARRRCGRRNLACNDSLRPSALKGSLKVLLVHQPSGTLGDVWRLIKLEGCVASAPTASFTFSKEMGLSERASGQVQVYAWIGR